MIVELVDVGCEGANGSSQSAAMQMAREAFIALCGQPSSSSFKTCTAVVTVTGVPCRLSRQPLKLRCSPELRSVPSKAPD